MNALDAWITGNYGYDHPDNQVDPDEAAEERHRAFCRAMDRREAAQQILHGKVRTYVLTFDCDDPIVFSFCDHCASTTTNFRNINERQTTNKPCDECGWKGE